MASRLEAMGSRLEGKASKNTFASVRGSAPVLESIEHQVEQTAILVPIHSRLCHKAPEKFEAFVEEPVAFQKGQPVLVAQQPGQTHDIREHSIVLSCSSEPSDLEHVSLTQRVLTTDPRQICEQLTQFWQPIWQRDDSHLLTPELEQSLLSNSSCYLTHCFNP